MFNYNNKERKIQSNKVKEFIMFHFLKIQSDEKINKKLSLFLKSNII